MSSEQLHEPAELLSEETKNMHRALVTLIEELEAVDWYQQRADACSEPGLHDVLIHNKNEEVEHAMMTLEWIRRRSPVFDAHMRTYLFTERPILELEEEDTGSSSSVAASPTSAPSHGSLGIGSLRQEGKED
ncbi:encapsulin-associated ferritin-like protein [Haliangium ochraceum]|uniref:Encapsulated ferritin-like protein n=1 Tax=Haliangium ochraceum (strain DSM 14365 / JCM 11303 / SMP-2) TaxID=502025 RepID=FER_HALO1|nr:ferritin-like domain-containing protein [Haliangium ochraceum]D0LZ73.1 RecName: Full=Encapsulated ferritin-like protein; Short=EncFtn [Haliangium ochraceum DSM 14365]7OE2_1 Chain 1, Haliangium ochraceum Encapsulated ferritin localisation sequence [Haliangium ochraceum DSM 14365]7OE2_2 Chain 2, Haliangium ochraceum Encapsulated ferritin localisation sequence [Haliangium ochraceum DSM 14365]7OE2_3 Chain 3, Haliangium ochraceum Encapsulated ferritin localisation sequence [Haliangium ochraceum D